MTDPTITCECGAITDQPCPHGKPECEMTDQHTTDRDTEMAHYIDNLDRNGTETLAALILRDVAAREPTRSAMQLVHLAIRLDAFAKEPT